MSPGGAVPDRPGVRVSVVLPNTKTISLSALTCHAFSQSSKCPAEPMRAPKEVQKICVESSLKRGLVCRALWEKENALIHSASSLPSRAKAGKKMRTER